MTEGGCKMGQVFTLDPFFLKKSNVSFQKNRIFETLAQYFLCFADFEIL